MSTAINRFGVVADEPKAAFQVCRRTTTARDGRYAARLLFLQHQHRLVLLDLRIQDALYLLRPLLKRLRGC